MCPIFGISVRLLHLCSEVDTYFSDTPWHVQSCLHQTSAESVTLSVCRDEKPANVCTKAAYVLFYQRRGAPPPEDFLECGDADLERLRANGLHVALDVEAGSK